jgi:hypothetical protein
MRVHVHMLWTHPCAVKSRGVQSSRSAIAAVLEYSQGCLRKGFLIQMCVSVVSMTLETLAVCLIASELCKAWC